MITILIFLQLVSPGKMQSKTINANSASVNYYVCRQVPLDSFNYHYKMLDSINRKNPYDTSETCSGSIKFMESVTGLKAHSDGDFFGWFLFNRDDLTAWKNWYRAKKK